MRCWGLAPLSWLAKAIARLPQRALLDLGAVLTALLWPLLGSRRRVAAKNLELCFPEFDAARRARLVRANLRNTVTGALELVRAWYAPSWRLRGMATIEGLEHLHAARAAGQGVLLFTGHFPNAELAVRLLGEQFGKPIGGVVRENNHACLQEEFDRARRRVSGPLFAKKDLRGLLRALQGGEIIAYSADQNFNYQHAFVPFFGVPAATLTTPPQIVARGNARMLPFFFHRDDAGHYHLRISQAWPGWQEGTPEEAATIYMRELEAVVREHPEDYLWVHRRFKTRPEGEAPVY
jgi:KDO2-lipid IV(A) lauroyltransferase